MIIIRSLNLTFNHLTFPGAFIKSSLATFKKRSQRILSGHHFYRDQQFDLDIWPRDLKIKKTNLLSSGIYTHVPILATLKQRGQKILSGHRLVNAPINWSTRAKQYSLFSIFAVDSLTLIHNLTHMILSRQHIGSRPIVWPLLLTMWPEHQNGKSTLKGHSLYRVWRFFKQRSKKILSDWLDSVLRRIGNISAI